MFSRHRQLRASSFAHLWMVTFPFLLELPSRTDRQVQKLDGPGNSWPLGHGEAVAAAAAAPAVGG